MLPAHMFVKHRRPNLQGPPDYEAKYTRPVSLEGVLSEKTESLKGTIISAVGKSIEYDLPDEAQSGMGYEYLLFSIKEDKTGKKYRLIQPMSDGCWNDPNRIYKGLHVEVNYKPLLSRSISSIELVSNFIWPVWDSQGLKQLKVYPKRYEVFRIKTDVKAEGILIEGIDLELIKPYK